MLQSAAPNLHGDADRLEAATDQAIAACGGDVRAVVCELMQAVSHACVRGRFNACNG